MHMLPLLRSETFDESDGHPVSLPRSQLAGTSNRSFCLRSKGKLGQLKLSIMNLAISVSEGLVKWFYESRIVSEYENLITICSIGSVRI